MDTAAITPIAIDEYCDRHTTSHDEVLARIERETCAEMESPQMLSGHVVGGLLAILAATGGARRVLEVGTFTGYSALSIAQVLGGDGRVVTCEYDGATARVAQANLDAHPAGGRVEIVVGPALETIAWLDGPFDLVFLDAAKSQYCDYLDLVLPKLSPRGLVVADNTLWSGAVLDVERVPDGERDATFDDDTAGLARFNERVSTDPELRAVLLPVRDGLTLVMRR